MDEFGFNCELPYGCLNVSGDEKHGFRPDQLLVSSIAVCSGEVLRRVLKGMRLEVENIQIETSTEHNKAQANRIEKICTHFILTGGNLPKEKIEKALQLTKKNCPMAQSVIGSIELVQTFEVV